MFSLTSLFILPSDAHEWAENLLFPPVKIGWAWNGQLKLVKCYLMDNKIALFCKFLRCCKIIMCQSVIKWTWFLIASMIFAEVGLWVYKHIAYSWAGASQLNNRFHLTWWQFLFTDAATQGFSDSPLITWSYKLLLLKLVLVSFR